MVEEDIEAVRRRIGELRTEHRDLDDVISRLQEVPELDELQIRRLKKRKLLLKDHISMLERQLTPDIA